MNSSFCSGPVFLSTNVTTIRPLKELSGSNLMSLLFVQIERRVIPDIQTRAQINAKIKSVNMIAFSLDIPPPQASTHIDVVTVSTIQAVSKPDIELPAGPDSLSTNAQGMPPLTCHYICDQLLISPKPAEL